MKAIDLIHRGKQLSDEFTIKFLEDMHDAPMTQPTALGGNHPLWVAGHLAVSEGQIPAMLFGESNPVEHWKPLFDGGTQPTTDASDYPPYEEVLRTYRDLRERNLKLLDEIGDEGLDRPTAAPMPGAENYFDTFGQVFLTMTMHQEFHCGQIADARRAAGRKPLFF